MVENYTELLVSFLEQKVVGPVPNPWDIPYWLSSFYDNLYRFSADAYVTEEGFIKHKQFHSLESPLQMISMNSREGLLETFSWRKRMQDYRAYEIQKHLGLTFNEWLAYPTFIQTEMLNIFKQEKIERDKAIEDAKSEMDNQYNNPLEDMINRSAYR